VSKETYDMSHVHVYIPTCIDTCRERVHVESASSQCQKRPMICHMYMYTYLHVYTCRERARACTRKREREREKERQRVCERERVGACACTHKKKEKRVGAWVHADGPGKREGGREEGRERPGWPVCMSM